MLRILIVLFMTTLCITAQQKDIIQLPSNSDISILYVGDYQKGELDPHTINREWWGLYEKNNISYIKKVKLELKQIEPDIQYDWEYRISVEDSKHCIILISGLNLKERQINHYTSVDIIRENQDFTFEFGPYHTYLSSKLETIETIGEVQRKDYSIHLNYKSNEEFTTQELFLFPCYSSPLNVSLSWGGDLDDDGKTDFLLNIPTLPNNELGFSLGLFLSSKAKKQDLVKLVAFYTQKGC